MVRNHPAAQEGLAALVAIVPLRHRHVPVVLVFLVHPSLRAVLVDLVGILCSLLFHLHKKAIDQRYLVPLVRPVIHPLETSAFYL